MAKGFLAGTFQYMYFWPQFRTTFIKLKVKWIEFKWQDLIKMTAKDMILLLIYLCIASVAEDVD